MSLRHRSDYGRNLDKPLPPRFLPPWRWYGAIEQAYQIMGGRGYAPWDNLVVMSVFLTSLVAVVTALKSKSNETSFDWAVISPIHSST